MGGGKYNYIYLKILEFAEEMKLTDLDDQPHPKREEFQKLLFKVAEAAKAIEYTDCGDRSSDVKEIDAVLEFLSRRN